MKLRHLAALIVAAALVLGIPALAQLSTTQLTLTTPPPPNISRATATVVGAAGRDTIYYWVSVRYPSGIRLPYGPIAAFSSVGIGNLSGANFVTISWTPLVGATGYDVLRQATNAPFSTCAACAVVLNTAATSFNDTGGATFAWPPAGVNFVSTVSGQIFVNNRDEVSPFIQYEALGGRGRILYTTPAYGLDLTSGLSVVGGAFSGGDVRGINSSILANETALRWRSDSEIRVAGPGDAYLDWSARTDPAVYGFRSRIQSNLTGGGVAALGAQFMSRASAGGAGGGAYIGARGSAVQDAAGYIGSDILTGLYGDASPSVGLLFGSYGVFGIFQPSGTATAGAGMFAAGVKGDFDDAIGMTTLLETTGGVMGFISDQDTPGPTGAVVAVLGAAVPPVRTAPNAPTSAFRIVDWHPTLGVNFDYGFDAFWTDGVAAATIFNIADIRGQSGDRLDNATVGTWTLTRGSGDFTGLALEAVLFANLGAPANGTIVYCSNCDPAAVGAAWAVCSTGGASTGALAVRIAGAWNCY